MNSILTYGPFMIAWGALCADKPRMTGALAAASLAATSLGLAAFFGSSKHRALAPPGEPGLMMPMYIMTADILIGSFNGAIWAGGIWVAVACFRKIDA